METASQSISHLLQRWSRGDRVALDELMPLVYGELRRIAHRQLAQQRAGHTLQTTALLHEAYLRLAGQEEKHWENRAHFFAVAAQAMRHILVDYARAQQREKRGGGAQRLSLDEALTMSAEQGRELVALDDALTDLAKLDERQSRVVELRFFGGLSEAEIADVLQISQRTVSSDWHLARAWLLRQLDKGMKDERVKG
jgi:RNA polymerase sigma-70 factor, ECF subfamily